MAEYIERRATLDSLYAADALTYNGMRIIHQLPTADVAPVVHGKWELQKNNEIGVEIYVHVCSVCGAIVPVPVSRYNYCPNCGARMDGDKDA